MNIKEALKYRTLVLDGAMGTMIQRYKFSEEDYRGTQFAHWPSNLKGNNDLLCLTQANAILERILHQGMSHSSRQPTPLCVMRVQIFSVNVHLGTRARTRSVDS